jgi:hypothetical protein
VFTTGWICRGDPVASDPCCSGGQDPVWGRSSAGRAPALQAGGHRFDPGRLHHPRLQSKRVNKHQPISATMVLPQRNNGSSRFVGMRPTHRNAGLPANHESAECLAWLVPCFAGGLLCWRLLLLVPLIGYCIAECPQFGWIMCLGKASWACGHAECAVA